MTDDGAFDWRIDMIDDDFLRMRRISVARPDWLSKFLAGDVPYATLDDAQAKQLADDWRAGNRDKVIAELRKEIHVHQMCDNYIKAGHLQAVVTVLDSLN